MTTLYEKIANRYLLDGEALWSVYLFTSQYACVTDQRLIFIEVDRGDSVLKVEIGLCQIKLITTRYSNLHKRIISIYYDNFSYSFRVDANRVHRFLNDVYKHKIG